MSAVTVFIESIGLCGPGLESWAAARPMLRSEVPYVPTKTIIAPSAFLPPAERRRVGTIVKLALAAGHDALLESPYKASELLSVFSSSGGDGDNCHAICEALASSDRLISPTRFTNSVHNAPSGYWGIALQARPASTSLCAYDGSFSAGFLEACTQAITARAPVLLLAYDAPYPEPLHATRKIADSIGVALLLSPVRTQASIAALQVSLGQRTVATMLDPLLESLRLSAPAARSLPLLQAVAQGDQSSLLALDLFDNQQLLVQMVA